jgi:hypothetical protein
MPDRYATADERLRFLAAAMHNEAVTLWNLAHLAEHHREVSRGEPFPHRDEIEAVQRTLSAIAWPATESEAAGV